jgi:DNA-binding LacI/PurR family transcriptional regulator
LHGWTVNPIMQASVIKYKAYLGIEKDGLPAHYGKEEHLKIIDEVSRILSIDGWEVKIENGADLRAEKAGKRIAIEVETYKGNNEDQIVENILKNLKWADGVIVISPNQQTRTKIGNLIRNQRIEKVVLLTYHEMSENLNGVDRDSIQNGPE